MRARYPDHEGLVDCDGVEIFFEIYDRDGPTIVLLPAWLLAYSRLWKFQIPYLARYYRVLAFDPPGNGRSSRPLSPLAYSVESRAGYCLGVLDATETAEAIFVGLSDGGQVCTYLMANHPDRVLAAVMFGPAVPVLAWRTEKGQLISDNVDRDPSPLPKSKVPLGGTDPHEHWIKYNPAYWVHDLEDFLWFFYGKGFPETHSTKGIEDSVVWGLGTEGRLLGIEARAPAPNPDAWRTWAGEIRSPGLIIHGDADEQIPIEFGEELARLCGADFVTVGGGGHFVNVRHPVQVNLLIRDFVEGVAP